MLHKLGAFWQKETVLCIAALCALATMLLVPPDSAYLTYIDTHVLCLLLCLMAVVAGLQACGIFKWLTYHMLKGSQSGRLLGVALVLLPFFCSMLVTNDVALLVFVPFTLGLLRQINCPAAIAPMLVLQTIAANLGSMATPVGNPQNLFLYSAYNLNIGAFFSATLPFTLISLLFLLVGGAVVLPAALPGIQLTPQTLQQPRQLGIYVLLFAVCLLAVFHLLPDILLLPTVLLTVGLLNRRLLQGLDYALLVTFICFFIVSGNLGRLTAVHSFLQALLADNTLFTAIGTSQFISNVPAAVLLSGFTDQWRELLAGVNIGGLGTPVASLASLITLKQYMRCPKANIGRFLLIFTLANLLGLAVLIPAACWLS